MVDAGQRLANDPAAPVITPMSTFEIVVVAVLFGGFVFWLGIYLWREIRDH